MQRLKFKSFLFAISTLVLFSCAEESPFITKEEAKKQVDDLNTSRDPFHAMKDIVAIINNDIYYFTTFDGTPKKLTNSPADIKKHVKLSHDKSQIAYINKNGNPVIIRSDNGQVITTLTQYSFVDQMDWVKDRLTLYMLIDRKVFFYGPSIKFTQPASTHSWDEVPSFSMNSIGDQAYFIRYYGGSYVKTLKFHSDNLNKDESFQMIDGEMYDHVDFYDNKGNFLLGYTDPFDDEISRVVCLQDYKFFPKYEWDDELMRTPTFNAELEILLYGTAEGKYQIKAVYLGTSAYESHGLYDRLTKVLTTYTSSSPISLDWVQ